MVSREDFALPKENLVLLAVGFVIILIGCICMIGGGSSDGVSFNPEIFSSMRITVAPIILVFGFFFEVFAIVWLRKEGTSSSEYCVNEPDYHAYKEPEDEKLMLGKGKANGSKSKRAEENMSMLESGRKGELE